jgi:hypothetical protein
MRSCEYSKTPQRGKTRTLTVNDVSFYDNKKKLVPHDHPDLAQAEYVSCNFKDQKNGEKQIRRTQRRNNDPVLNPVPIWARIIQRIRAYPATTDNTHVYFWCHPDDNHDIRSITSGSIRSLLRTYATDSCGNPLFGYSPDEIGTHSIRSGAAMALALEGSQDLWKIMILGRWKSSAVFDYIQPQIMEMSHDISQAMIAVTEFNRLPKQSSPSRQRQHPPGSVPNLFSGFGGKFQAIMLPYCLTH